MINLGILSPTSIVSFYVIFSFIFYYYFGFARLYISLAGYLLSFFCVLIKLNSNTKINYVIINLSIISSICILFTFANSNFNFLSVIYSYRLYFGCFILIAFFTTFQNIISRQLFLYLSTFLSSITLLERFFFLINPSLVLNLPHYLYADKHNDVFEFTARTYYQTNLFAGTLSFGASRSVTGVCLLALFIMLVYMKASLPYKCITLTATLIAGSATSAFLLFVIFIIYFFKNISSTLYNSFVRYKIKLFQLILITLLSIMFILAIYNLTDSFKGLGNFKISYFLLIIQIKLDIIRMYLSNLSFLGFFFGGDIQLQQSSENLSGLGAFQGDFILIDMLARTGLLSILLYIYIISKVTINYYKYPLIIILVGSIHYPILFSGPGQVLFALISSGGLNNIKLLKTDTI